jgi:nicotinate-nucleotide adenylyltransferase
LKIGLFFGSFNPPHIAHLKIAEYFYKQASLDSIWYVLSPKNPLKNEDFLVSANLRNKMLMATIKNQKFAEICKIEFSLPPPYYTYRTLKKIKFKNPNHIFEIIMGEDNHINLNEWEHGDWIKKKFTIHCYPRILKREKKNSYFKHYLNISSSKIRQAIFNKQNINKLVPQSVKEIIKKHNLYQLNNN